MRSSGSSTGRPFISDVTRPSPVVVVVGGIVVEVVLVDVMVVGGSVVVEASDSAAPAVQAERISPSATNLAIVVRIRASLESEGDYRRFWGQSMSKPPRTSR